jgi:hypothetical protein
VRLFHATTPDAAATIMREGFRDAEGSYMLVNFVLRGVFVSDVPLDENEGCKGGELLEVTLPDDVDLDDFELVEEGPTGMGMGYREWCVPAETLNSRGSVRCLTEDQADAARDAARARRFGV